MTTQTQLAQLICTRLCHDLAGPVGAVAAGVELVGDDPSMVDQETLALIAASSAAAGRKLKFLRIAFGTMAQSSPAALNELEGSARGYFEAIAGPSGAIALSWPSAADLTALQDRVGPAAVPVLINSILVAAEAAPRTKHLTVSVIDPAQSDARIQVSASLDQGAAIRTDIVDAVSNPDSVLASARNAQALYWAALCRDGGFVADVRKDDNSLTAIVSFGSQ